MEVKIDIGCLDVQDRELVPDTAEDCGYAAIVVYSTNFEVNR